MYGGLSRRLAAALTVAIGACGSGPSTGTEEGRVGAALASGKLAMDPVMAGRLARLALDCVHREYPNKIAHVLGSDEDARPPHELTPAFYGCFDWHSAVHGHWLLVRLARQVPDGKWVSEARDALGRSLTAENLAAEVRYMSAPHRAGFERPYGLAWLLQLSAELHQWDDPSAAEWAAAIEPLERVAVERLRSWLPKLSHPIRIGEHAQTAFAMGLIHDWSVVRGDAEMEALIESRARDFHGRDRACPLAYEPSGHDFLSPCLAEADLMRRVLPPDEFHSWLTGALPGIPLDARVPWLEPALPPDRADGKLAHLDGLNLSRAWMLRGIAAGLPGGDPRRGALAAAAGSHAGAGLEGVSSEHYAGSHWLGTFATYLLTDRGLSAQ